MPMINAIGKSLLAVGAFGLTTALNCLASLTGLLRPSSYAAGLSAG
jgi:hypothetical protein